MCLLRSLVILVKKYKKTVDIAGESAILPFMISTKLFKLHFKYKQLKKDYNEIRRNSAIVVRGL